MPDEPRRTLKVASVVGRVFEAPILPGAYPELGTLDEVIDQLDELRTRRPVSLDRDPSRPTCSSTSRPRRSPTRACRSACGPGSTAGSATGSSKSDPDRVDRRLDLLAHHFWLSDDEDRKRSYLARAAEAAQQRLRERRGDPVPGALDPLARGARAGLAVDRPGPGPPRDRRDPARIADRRARHEP